MRFFSVTVGLAALSTVFASTAAVESSLKLSLGKSLSKGNHYGAPFPPWDAGGKPGWYFGDHPNGLDLSLIVWLKDGLICKILELLPLCLHCPKPPHTSHPPSDGYTQNFSNLTAATQAEDYITYGLVDTIADCKAMCNSMDSCTFVNTYHDNNGKGGSPQLTCSLFQLCHDSKDAINAGGQTEPDGSVNYITESNGFCKH